MRTERDRLVLLSTSNASAIGQKRPKGQKTKQKWKINLKKSLGRKNNSKLGAKN